MEGPAHPARAGEHLRPGRPDHARDLPVRRDVPGHQHRDAAGAHLRHARAAVHHSPGAAGPAARVRARVRPGGCRAGRRHGDRRDDGLRPGRDRIDLAGRPHRRRRRGAGGGPRAARQRVRPQRVPGRAVHAGDRAAAVLPLRAARRPRADGRLAAGDQRRPAADLRGRGPAGGRPLRGPDGQDVAATSGSWPAPPCSPSPWRRRPCGGGPAEQRATRPTIGTAPREPRHPGGRPGRRARGLRRAGLRRGHHPRDRDGRRGRPGARAPLLRQQGQAVPHCGARPRRPRRAAALGAGGGPGGARRQHRPHVPHRLGRSRRTGRAGARPIRRRERVDGEAAPRVPRLPGPAPRAGHPRPAPGRARRARRPGRLAAHRRGDGPLRAAAGTPGLGDAGVPGRLPGPDAAALPHRRGRAPGR